MSSGAEALERRDLVPEDDSWFGHERSDDPLWNESAWFGFCIPDRNIDGWLYFFHRPNMNLTAGGVAIWDGVGEERHNCLYYHWFPFNPLPGDGSDQFNFKLLNGLSMELLEPLNKYRGRFETKACQLDLVWEGALPAQPTWAAQGTKDFFPDLHYDQHCHVEGTIVLRGEKLTVDCFHGRDRSWGPRLPLTDLAGRSLEVGTASERTSFFVMTMRPDENLDLDAHSVDQVVMGHFVKDGELSHIASGERCVVERRRDGCPRQIVVDVRGTDGRELHVAGEVQNCLKYNDLYFAHWALVKWEIDGAPGWGETQELLSEDLIRAYQRRALIPQTTRAS